MDDKPKYLTENADGTVTVELRSGRRITMREPTIADQLATKGNNEERELTLVGNLCLLSPEEVRALTLRDYQRVQAALMLFRD
ncbi:phage tail assembly protein [Cereibacter sphaeroides]|uniref:phage tail assembly protein n=1 Tax=Cereibacter sphaeroides TaxID=1063 RepID=UPI000F51EEC5|nr:phage tail assembly protein [Cereibacter sphaeroides]AZB63855.1 phage tail assembly protein [Cereibacter sphaeroides]AZB68223.1 phage tail assembly protein [Cereibacter sphaeroides]